MPRMSPEFSCLAPLQRMMLWDSLAANHAGCHVEQVDIVLARGLSTERVLAAWERTIVRTDALRTAFVMVNNMPAGVEQVASGLALIVEKCVPRCWESWLEADRLRPLPFSIEVPWRASWWPEAGRFIWTFHHALLDGRSIARIVRQFLNCLESGDAEPLAISKWREPSSEMIARAGQLFRNWLPSGNREISPDRSTEASASRSLGDESALRLKSVAAKLGVTAATLVTWCWGQALTAAMATDTVWIEQVRAGEPQPGTAGFTMLTLPIVIQRDRGGEMNQQLKNFRGQLLELREIEAVSPDDFPPGDFPDMDGPGTSVIMVEHGTLQHLVGVSALVESLVLHESKGETLIATAYLLPDLSLKVEGPGRQELLDRWISVLQRVMDATEQP